ncbi:MAG: hypothetical protein B7X95_02920 [Methylophilaceae bacterium 17-44-8]|jgi:hypothetical protein|nr:MAG: hypothetical protein B7Y48_04400 [Methylophilales bacterium 28-44-11]OZA06405.1 MAG: hypothetical protein B7X95_02920 [Methylophilaceae bacterium 17-44-8]
MISSKLMNKVSASAAALMTMFVTNTYAADLIAINSANQISIFNANSADDAVFTTITGAASGESFIGIDLRPSNSLVYGITQSNKIYTIDAYSGNSTFVANLANPVIAAGKSYGFDFNPVADIGGASSLRLVSSTGDNYAINVNTGAVTLATSLIPGFTGVSYTNSNASNPTTVPSSTALYYINSANDTLNVATTAFNNPSISIIGSLGLDVLSANGFEIDANGIGYAAVNMDNGFLKSELIRINTMTGQAEWVSTFNGTINGLTVAAVPEPETYAMLIAGLGILGFSARRQKK